MLLSTCPAFWIPAVVESDSKKADEILECAIQYALDGSSPPELTKKKKSECAALDPNHSTICKLPTYYEGVQRKSSVGPYSLKK